MEGSTPDKIKDKLLKLSRLAEQGYKGEAIAAKRALAKMLDKYGLTIEDLLDEKPEWRWIRVGRNKNLKKLLLQCHFKIINKGTARYKSHDTEIAFELTNSQYADLMSLYDFHSRQFKLEYKKIQDSIVPAYIQKHKIWNDPETDEENSTEDPTPIKKEDIDKIITTLHLMEQMEDVGYHKQIE